jgi:hypothetical protein
MEEIKIRKKTSNIFKKKTIYNRIKLYNSPIFPKKRFKNYILINDDIPEKKNKKSFDSKVSKYNKSMNHTNTTISKKKVNIFKDKDLNFTQKKLINAKFPYSTNENSKKISYIKKKITYQPINAKIISKKNSNNSILNIFKKKNKILSKFSIKNIINSSGNVLNNKNNSSNSHYENKIYLNKNDNSSSNKKFYSSRFSISLDNILSKTKNKNQNQIKGKKNSLEKPKKSKILKEKLSGNKINKTKFQIIKTATTKTSKNILNNNLKNTKINLEKDKNIFRHHRQKLKSENLSEIINNFSKSILSKNNDEKRITNINHINGKNNCKKDKIINSPEKYLSGNKTKCDINYSKDFTDLILDEGLKDAKQICENNSTNDKSLNTKNDSNKKKTSITPNIIINKFNNYQKNKLKNGIQMDNDGFLAYYFDLDNEQNNKINGVKTNNFDVKKPKEENLKFTIMKEEKESEISCSRASKIIIGSIDGYKDIIEDDKKNRDNTFSKCFKHLINKNFGYNKNGREIRDLKLGVKEKMSNLSTLLKKENDSSINEYNFYDSFNMTNNIDGISSTITNNILNEKKLESININYKNPDNNNKSKKNRNFNSISFHINTDKSIEDISKIINHSIIKDNNLEILPKNDNKNSNYTNKLLCNQNKIVSKEEIEDLNNTCKFF